MMEPVTVESRVRTASHPMTRLKSNPSATNRQGLSESSLPAMKSKSYIPFFYRLSLLYAEPFFALGGAIILYLQPSAFLTTMTPAPSPATIKTLSSVRVLTDQLAAMQVLLAFNTGLVLRYAAAEEDRKRGWRLWRLCCSGMLICDMLHVAASIRELGWDVFLAPAQSWRVEDWVNFVILGWMGLVRVAVVLGIGMTEDNEGLKRRQVVREDSSQSAKA